MSQAAALSHKLSCTCALYCICSFEMIIVVSLFTLHFMFSILSLRENVNDIPTDVVHPFWSQSCWSQDVDAFKEPEVHSIFPTGNSHLMTRFLISMLVVMFMWQRPVRTLVFSGHFRIVFLLLLWLLTMTTPLPFFPS